jgi:hypothetical protein
VIADEEMDDFLRDSAATIDQASEAVTCRRYAEFMEACQARTERQVLNQQADMNTYAEARDKDLADYERAERAQAIGDLHMAAEWYRKAAGNEFADSALKLAKILELIAERHVATPGHRAASGELFHVVEEASYSYIAAYMVGDIETDELGTRLDQLINYLDPTRASSRPVLIIAASTDEPETNEPRPRPESLSLASVDDELRPRQGTHLEQAGDQPSTR